MSRKARLGFIGAGWWATANYMPLLAAREDVEMVAVCRLGTTELRQVQQAFGFRFATENAAELVARTDLDGVLVTSPHTLHHEHARLALERGLHVLCDKPMCTRADHAQELVDLARARNLHLLVPYGWHYKPFIQTARSWLQAGRIGAIQFALCHMASPIRSLLQGHRFVTEGNSGQAGGALFEPDPRTWADPLVAGGGYAQAQLSHSTGLLSWLTGLVPESVAAFMAAPDAPVDLYDAITVRFQGGAIGTVSGAGTVPPGGITAYQVDLRLFGSEGMLLLDCERARLELRRHDGQLESLSLAPDAGAYSCEGPPVNFVELILGKTAINHSPGAAALQSVRIIDAAYRSAASGKVERA
ncbi:MAG: Gfo/Idh/MocA family oxidoreductase [Gemmataceae bacterium]